MKRLWGLANLWRRGRPPVGTTPSDIVHQENKWRLLRYRSKSRKHKTPVLLVPSLINRHYVLDLLPDKSFAGHFVQEGHDVYIIDWGTPSDEDRFLTFDTVCDRYIGRAVRRAMRISGADGVHLLGYCLGGTLTTIYAAAHPEQIRSLVALAAPIRFDDKGMLSTWVRSSAFNLGALVKAFGNVPWPMMQASFHLLRPTLNMTKVVSLIDRAWNDEFLDGFLAIEAWGSDNVSFPGECYRKYVDHLYREDRLVNGTFTLSGRPARLENITCPTLVVTFEHDHIVPWESGAVLVDRVGSTQKERLHLMGGHVGAVVSKKAAVSLWPKLSAFWQRNDPRPQEVLRVARSLN